MKLYVVLASAIFLSACSSNVQSYSNVDQEAKTVFVPAGSKGLKGALKKALSERGWKLVVTPGSEIIEGRIGSNTRLEKYSKFGTRYTLVGEERKIDYCFNFSPFIAYEVTLIDNSNGKEIITMDGKNCQDEVVQQFVNAIENKQSSSLE